MSVLLFDTETTGSTDPVRIIQAAWLVLDPADFANIQGEYNEFFNPGREIEFGSMAVHGILPKIVAHSRSYEEFQLPEGTEYIIGHQIDYDWKVAGKPSVKRICTLALARHFWPQADSHTLLALLYMREARYASRVHRLAHNALADVRMNHVLLMHICKAGAFTSMEELYAASETARIPQTMPFGKHKGEAIATIPLEYLTWLSRQQDVDEYLRIAIERRTKPQQFTAPQNTLPF